MSIEECKDKLEFGKVINQIIKYTYSDLGKHKCNQMTFITDKSFLESELDKVVEMKELILYDGNINLDGLKDIREILDKINIEGNFVSSEKYNWILDFLKISRAMKSYINGLSRKFDKKFNKISFLANNLFYDTFLEHDIESTVDYTGEVKDSASSELKRIREDIVEKSNVLRKILQKIIKTVSEQELSQEEIITLRDGRSVIPVKVENKRKVKGIIHSSSSSGATVFVEPAETIEMNNEITELQFSEKREISRILIELSKKISENYEQLKLNCDILSELDFLQAKAKYSIESMSEKPIIDENILELENAYHPVLLQNLGKQNVIPLNLKIGENYNTLIVTGPNAGGKTVALKTIGLLQLMFQSAILVPVSAKSKFRIFRKIFINVGDEQSIENNLSTFSSHLQSLKYIIENSDDKTLVLIDEICAGTDPSFGSALSSAILKYLSSENSISVVTTHIGELKSFAYNTDGIENASLEFDSDTLSPNFNFVTGIPGQSFTFEIARKYSFPDNIISESENYLKNEQTALENLLKKLNEDKQTYSRLKRDYDIHKTRLKGLVDLYAQKMKEINKAEREILKKTKTEAENILRNANKLVEKTIKEIKEKQKISIPEIKKEFTKKSDELIKKIRYNEPQKTSIVEFKPGLIVKIIESNTTGEIMEIKKGVAIIDVNGIRIKAGLSEIKIAESNEIRNYAYDKNLTQINTTPVSYTLDLRGKFTDEIKDIIINFLNESRLNGLNEVIIIHGKGTGKLREKVKEILKKIPYIKSTRYGNWNEGDSGVSIVELQNK